MPKKRRRNDSWFEGLFEANSPWRGVASAVASTVQQATAPQREVADQLMQFIGHLNRNVVGWFMAPVPEPCADEDCSAQAVLYCVACKSPICLGHAHLNHAAEGVCAACVEKLTGQVRRRPAPRAREHDVKWAQGILGIKRGATMRDITNRFRKLAAEHHPDRAKTTAQAASMQQKMAEITEAYEILKNQYAEQAA